MENMSIWNNLKTPPATALKEIHSGRLKGKSDINPQWRYEALTEQFGPCGVGWKYTIDQLWVEPGVEGQMFVFARVSLYHKQGDSWSDAIPGIGGDMAVKMESRGLYHNDECYKMAVTDALGVAAKMIGVAADIYRGGNSDSKYSRQTDVTHSQPTQRPVTPRDPSKKISEKQVGLLNAEISKRDVDRDAFKAYLEVESLKDITMGNFDSVLTKVRQKPIKMEG